LFELAVNSVRDHYSSAERPPAVKEAESPNACVPQASRRHMPGPGHRRIQLDRALQNPCPCVGRGESLLRYRSSKNSVKTNIKGHGPVGPRRNASIRCLLKSHCMARSAPCAGATGVGAPRSEAARKRPRLFAPRRAPGLPTGLWPMEHQPPTVSTLRARGAV